VTILIAKLKLAAQQYGIKNIAIAGGVSANSGLRKDLADTALENGWNIFIPKFEYCTDNAAMIAMTAHYKFLKKDFVGQDVAPSPRMKW
jgi:N6-L-threonylcarbamoyladenine synthase